MEVYYKKAELRMSCVRAPLFNLRLTTAAVYFKMLASLIYCSKKMTNIFGACKSFFYEKEFDISDVHNPVICRHKCNTLP